MTLTIIIKTFYSNCVIDSINNINLEENIELKLNKFLDVLKNQFPSKLGY